MNSMDKLREVCEELGIRPGSAGLIPTLPMPVDPAPVLTVDLLNTVLEKLRRNPWY